MYSLNVYYEGDLYPSMDSKIEKILGKRSDGSGMGMGQRDLEFLYKSPAKAIEKFLVLKKLEGVQRVTIVWDEDN